MNKMLVPIFAGSVVVVTGSYVAYRAKKATSGLDGLLPLTPNLSSVMHLLNGYPSLDGDGPGVVSMAEVRVALKNFRAIQGVADSARLQDAARMREFEAVHQLLAENGRKMTQRLALAIIEKASNVVGRTTSQLCAAAVFACYIQHVLLVVNLLKVARDGRYHRLESHLYDVAK